MPGFKHWLQLIVLAAAGPLAAAAAGESPLPLELAGVTVTPHVGTPTVRYRQPPLAPLDARVQLFVRNATNGTSGAAAPFRLGRVLFNTKETSACLEEKLWSWHDSPAVWTPAEKSLPPGALVVWTINSVGKQLGNTLRVDIGDAEGKQRREFEIPIAEPQTWLAAVTFLGPEGRLYPDEMAFYVWNKTERVLRIADCRLFLPENGATWRWLYPRPWLGAALQPFAREGRIEPSELGGARIRTGPLPLTYAAVEVRLFGDKGEPLSLWAHLRIKKETFDISGGWVNSSTPNGTTLGHEAFLKTLRRMYVNTAHIADVPGYTDQTGPDGLYTRYPLKYFSRLWPLDRYDTDAMLPRIHAVEFLGEPQYRYGRDGKLPQQVWEAFLPYAPSRFPSTLTLSESQNWHLYAGVCDYAHYDAYRVTAPSADAWGLYDRWDEARIRWGAPLETIGDMTRSLRESSRPAPIAYWSQGAHVGWERYGGRARTSPTPDELRMQAYHALGQRITSLYWFNLSLPSLLKFRDLIEPITRVGREIRMLEPFYLPGAAYQYRQLQRAGKLDWDLASIVAPNGALLFALDLDYSPDPVERVFRFGPPREARFDFDLPSYLRHPRDVFRVEADGIVEVRHELTERGVRIEDRANKVAIYVATKDPDLRKQLEARRRELRDCEQSFRFSPADSDADFATLNAIPLGK